MFGGNGARTRARFGGLVVLIITVSLPACGSSAAKSRPPADLTVHIPRTDARDVPFSPQASTIDGNLRLTPLAAECGLTYLIGTHAEIDFKGQLCRLRLTVENVDNSFHRFDTTAQRLLDTTGKAVAPDGQAMDVKRQDREPLIGAGDALVLSLYFALAPHHVPAAFVLRGDNDPSGVGTSVTAPHRPQGVAVPIPRRALYTPKPIF